MGMTRAKRYANYKGGKKYTQDVNAEGEKKVQMEKSARHRGKEEKEESSLIFKEFWERCRAHDGYQTKKQEFLKEQKEWEKERKSTETVKTIKNKKIEVAPG